MNKKIIAGLLLTSTIYTGIVGSFATIAKAEENKENTSIEITNVETKETGAFVVDAKSGANLRSGPGTNYRIIKAFPRGTVLWRRQARPTNGWYNVETEDGKYVGWMHESTGHIE